MIHHGSGYSVGIQVVFGLKEDESAFLFVGRGLTIMRYKSAVAVQGMHCIGFIAFQ
jgi:hypothetical protein